MSRDDFAYCRVLGQSVRQETVMVDPKTGHTIELFLLTGQVVFRNGEIWTISQSEMDDLRNGSGSMQGHNFMVHPDGSTIVGAYQGKVKAESASNGFSFAGDWQYTSGTGRTAGIKGAGKFKGSGAGDKYCADCTGKASNS
jgi:hypothetical protein